ncbi:LysM peptidoglycan-binding domain-containing protein [Streptomyces sp. 15-116A]|uniref:LysM peptidoglycan-binding domain-containing protein n=1 Tax=Streptomyces sp. 15-116A TaxID=2259035 RepID=UPI0021B4CD9D|nr:LysM peptidoglycan-binding domain-containing protein [Streptomyces sp. 15-116A]MCT7352327.1 LysM peptidoglycan-binding domain-containing protein [Streptomyces sp. 15-116A]
MLSGNGRHRRPRQAPALLVAAGVTGSAIAIPLLGAGSASAADGATWDRVAECESGGSWSQNTGNGYYGGLQLTQDDWETYGGLDYAPSADQASRGQQIAVAERILADQGVGAWRACGLLTGLQQDSASADVDTGVESQSPASTDSPKPTPDATDPSGLPDSGESSASSSPSPSPSATETETEDEEGSETSTGETPKSDKSGGVEEEASPTPSASLTPGRDESDKSGQSSGSSSLTDTGDSAGAGRHRGPSAEEGQGQDRTPGSTGRHASRDTVDGSYTVRPGDSLWSIADSLEADGGWRALYAENAQTVGADPNLILPGQTLEVGVESGEK